MRIGVMLRHFEQKDGGVRVYTRHILPLLFAQGSAHEFVLIYQNPRLVGTYREHANVEEVVSRVPGTLLWDQYSIPRLVRKLKLDLVFNPKFTVPFFTRARTVFVLHGSEWFGIPEHFLWYDRLYFKRFVPAYCRAASAFVAVSHAVKRDAVAHVGVPEDKVQVIHNGFDPQAFRPVHDPGQLAAVREKYRLPREFVLWAGQIETRKNVGRLFQAMARIKDRIPHSLVIAGELPTRFPMAADAARDLGLIDELGIGSRVHFAGWISHDDLPAVYSLATAFVFPSLYEGFGIPLLEAMACACPILTSTTCAPPEVVDGAARLIDPLNVEAIAQGIVDLVQDETLRARLVARGLVRAQDFSWQRCAGELLALLERVGDGATAKVPALHTRNVAV